MSGRDDFATALEAIMARQREELGEPPTPEELLAWRDGLLDPAARERMEARIAVHPDAARALADLAAFPDLEPDPDGPELPDEEAGWLAFRARLADVSIPVPPPVRAPRPVPGWLAAAAVLALAAVGAGGFLAGRASRPLPGPGRNVVIAEVAPAGDPGEAVRASAPPVEIPEESDELLLILALPATETSARFTAEILDPNSARLWSGSGLTPTPEGTIRLSFRREAIPPGTYRIDLFGMDGRGRQKEGGVRYELRVKSP